MIEELPEHEERAIRDYVDGQINKWLNEDESPTEIKLVQKIRSYRLLGYDYDLFDVHTTDERYWVITHMTNLYSQSKFPSYDETFSFHAGLMMRLWERDRIQIEEEKEDLVGDSWRRYETAVQALDEAREAEDFQSVAIKCREALLAFGREHQGSAWVGNVDPRPKNSDFKGWARVYATRLATGRMRTYLAEIAAKTWDVSVSLQHDSNATVWDAEMLLDATQNVLGMFGTALVKADREPPRRCPKCDSYRLSTDGGIDVCDGVEGWASAEACGACDYRGKEQFRAFDVD